MTMMEQATNLTEKLCKVCGQTQPIGEYSRNIRSNDGFNGVCKKCRGLSEQTERGRQRLARRKEQLGETEFEIDEAFKLFQLGDPKKDFLIKQLLVIILTPGTNQQSQLRASEMLGEIHGLTKETPKSEEDLIHHAFQRLKQQNHVTKNRIQ